MVHRVGRKYIFPVLFGLFPLLFGCGKSDAYVLSELRELFLADNIIKPSSGDGTVVLRVNHTSGLLSIIISYPVKDMEMGNFVSMSPKSMADIDTFKQIWISDLYRPFFNDDLNFLKEDGVVMYSWKNSFPFPIVFIKKDTAYIVVYSFSVNSREKPWKAGLISHKP